METNAKYCSKKQKTQKIQRLNYDYKSTENANNKNEYNYSDATNQ